MPEASSALPVIYEDSEILVISKPPNLVVDPSQTQQSQTLTNILIKDYKITLERAGIVHRLDKDTSGLLVVAKTQAALDNLRSQFKNRLVKKEYVCLVHGDMKEKRLISAPIGRNPQNREKFSVLNEGREALTEFVPIKHLQMPDEVVKLIFADFSKIQLKRLYTANYPIFTLVSCFPKTGRTHQIRVHLKYIGFPIVGDSKYGGRKIVRLDHRFCSRQFLHASKVEFVHPKTAKRMIFESPMPADLAEVLNYLLEDNKLKI